MDTPLIVLNLPWPPSVNTYWRRNGSRYFIAPKGIKFRNDVYYLCQPFKNRFSINDKIAAYIEATYPDFRRRDLDNIAKAIFDSLQYAGVFHDDSQIEDQHIIKVGTEKPGFVRVHLALIT